MNISNTSWKIPERIEQELGLDDLPKEILEILIRRGFTSKSKVEEFICPPELPDPKFHFPELDKALIRIVNAFNNKEIIGICGDYDADGITSTTLLLDVFRNLNINSIGLIPSRDEDGYGLNINIVNQFKSKEVSLIITVDNGVSAYEAIDYAKSLDIDIIITDHHKIGTLNDNIYALIHPETTPKESPYKFNAGVGLAYILAAELAKRFNNEDCLSLSKNLLCIGTIADMAKLKGANRYWLKKYIPELLKTSSFGLKILINKSYLQNNQITSEDISFGIAPRINSVGRISNPELIVKCILEKDKQEASKLAKECEKINKKRKEISNKSVEEAIRIIKNQNNLAFILLAQSHWHHGIIGIIAARVMQKYKRPTAILSKDKNGYFRGSVRSPKYFDVGKALDKCAGLLEKFGGHSCAGGFTIKAENISHLEQKLSNYAEEQQKKLNPINSIEPEVYINISSITKEFISKLNVLEPFGVGNQNPIFWTRGCNVIQIENLFAGRTLITLRQKEQTIKALFWNKDEDFSIPRKVDIAFNIQTKFYTQDKKTDITILKIKPYKEKELFTVGLRKYECYICKDNYLIIENENQEKLSYNLINKEISPKEIKKSIYINHLISTAKSSLGMKSCET